MYAGNKGDYRFSADFRAQWAALGVKPFTTAFLSYDMPLKKWKEKWGIGGFIVSNKSGLANFQTLTVMGSAAYNIMNNTREHYLSTGLQMGLFYRSFNASARTYDSQYSDAAGIFDTSMPSGEEYNQSNMVRFDANIGVRYVYRPKGKNYRPFGGVSVYHLTMPRESFTDKQAHMPMRLNINGGCDIDISDEFSMQPRFIYMRQQKANDLDLGALFFYKIKDAGIDPLAGIDYRVKDAVIVHVGVRKGQSYFRFSYDVNTSYLKNYTSGRGAWEFSLIYVGNRKR
jgi:type IX secretion system PorP/SprF family membrane protein